jgi:putative NADPH-quinone reductase
MPIRAAREALEGAGHQVDLRDLHAVGLNPVLPAEEQGRALSVSANLAGIEEHGASLRAADALLLVYPTWWYGMPAMLKGWFDRYPAGREEHEDELWPDLPSAQCRDAACAR